MHSLIILCVRCRHFMWKVSSFYVSGVVPSAGGRLRSCRLISSTSKFTVRRQRTNFRAESSVDISSTSSRLHINTRAYKCIPSLSKISHWPPRNSPTYPGFPQEKKVSTPSPSPSCNFFYPGKKENRFSAEINRDHTNSATIRFHENCSSNNVKTKL